MQSGPIGLPGSPLYKNGAWMCPVDGDELEERPDQGIAVCQRCGHRYKIPEGN
jgi:ribosomal protein L37AE/L43A